MTASIFTMPRQRPHPAQNPCTASCDTKAAFSRLICTSTGYAQPVDQISGYADRIILAKPPHNFVEIALTQLAPRISAIADAAAP